MALERGRHAVEVGFGVGQRCKFHKFRRGEMPSRRVITGRSQEPRRRFAEELRLLRADKGDSLRQLEEVLGWNASTFGKMEGGQNLGSPEIVEALDQHYGTTPMLLTLWELAVADPSQFKEQYRRYMLLEAEAIG